MEEKSGIEASDEDWSKWVTNLDTGEKEGVDDVLTKFDQVTLSEAKSPSALTRALAGEPNDVKEPAPAKDDGSQLAEDREEKKDYEFTDLDFNAVEQEYPKRTESRDVGSKPISVPDGARLQFSRISAVGTSDDADGKPYSLFYLEVKCNVADPSQWVVYRRYSDFRRLSDLLRQEGYIVPILPPKKVIGVFELSFVRERKGQLESWLHSLVDKQLTTPGAKNLQINEHYRRFITSDGNKPPRPLTRIYPEHVLDVSNDAVTASGHKIGLSDFDQVRVIGKGSFGKVTLVQKKDTKRIFAMKVLNKNNIAKRKQIEHTKTERRVLGAISHPFIVRLHYAFQSDEKLYFVLDYAAGGELFFHLSRMKKFPEHMARFYAAEISMALGALHANGVVYRDLKPENILFDANGHVKLADFGLAKENVTHAAEGAHSLCGTPEYLSPEVLDRKGHGTAVDWWNLGMVTYEMLTGLPPWYTTDREKLFDRLRNANIKFPYYVSRLAASFVAALLIRNPEERLGAKGGDEVLAHSFFESLDLDGMLRCEVQPPFNPCRDKDGDLDTGNFESEFTNMAISVDGSEPNSAQPSPRSGYSSDRLGSDTFENFTFEEDSILMANMEAK